MRLRFHCALATTAGVGFLLANAAGGCTITTSDTSDGGLYEYDSAVPVDSSTATTTLLGFTPSNLGNLAAIDTTLLTDVSIAAATTIDTDVDDSLAIGTTTGSVVYQPITQSDGSHLGVYVARSWNIAAGAVVHARGAYPLVLVATGTITISGQLDASSTKNTAGAGALTPTTAGIGPGAGGDGVLTTGSAASGGTFCGSGGQGGYYTVATPATVATAYGSTLLAPLLAGASGGVGLLPPGAGGGAVQLVAGTSITLGSGGVLAANGGGGGNSGSVAAGAIQTGSGGGSGGALLLEAPQVLLYGVLAANGGGGGGNSGSYGQDGQNSGTAALGTGTGTGLGGNGSGDESPSGQAGQSGSGATGTGNDIPPGGGGGGAGRIRINTSSGAATVAGNALTSPASAACFSQGVLTP